MTGAPLPPSARRRYARRRAHRDRAGHAGRSDHQARHSHRGVLQPVARERAGHQTGCHRSRHTTPAPDADEHRRQGAWCHSAEAGCRCGAEGPQQIGWVVVVGLLLATFVTVFAVPTVHAQMVRRMTLYTGSLREPMAVAGNKRWTRTSQSFWASARPPSRCSHSTSRGWTPSA